MKASSTAACAHLSVFRRLGGEQKRPMIYPGTAAWADQQLGAELRRLRQRAHFCEQRRPHLLTLPVTATLRTGNACVDSPEHMRAQIMQGHRRRAQLKHRWQSILLILIQDQTSPSWREESEATLCVECHFLRLLRQQAACTQFVRGQDLHLP